MFTAEFLAAVGAVMTIVALISVGYALCAFGKINGEISSFISFVVVNVSLPCLMVYTILTSFQRDDIFLFLRYMLAPFVSIGLGYILLYS